MIEVKPDPCAVLDEGRWYAVYALTGVDDVPVLVARVATRAMAVGLAAHLTEDDYARRSAAWAAYRTGFGRLRPGVD